MRPIYLPVLVLFIALALAGRLPEVTGIIGSLPKDIVAKSRSKIALKPRNIIIPGKLRYGNSGVCGLFLVMYSMSINY